MFKRESAIKEKYNIGKSPYENKIGLTFSENRNLIIQQIAAWPNELDEMEIFISKELEIKKKINFNKGEVLSDKSVWRMEPLKWWLLGKTINIPESLGTSLELSHAFTLIKISGEKVRLLLNRHLPLDLRDDIFPINSSASSAIHHVSVKLFRINKDEYNLLIPRGFALSIWEILIESASQFGFEIENI
jgi:heterotetrameric sarcosine oxidase gamma subunit